LGSAHYSKHPLVPPGQVVLNINIDMVGRSTGTVYCINTGCDEVFDKTVAIGKETGVTVLPDPHPSWRLVCFVDSYHFARFDIPFIEFITEFHSDYHQPSDEIEKIRLEELGRILEVMFELTKVLRPRRTEADIAATELVPYDGLVRLPVNGDGFISRSQTLLGFAFFRDSIATAIHAVLRRRRCLRRATRC
jgi:hypothetical protein